MSEHEAGAMLTDCAYDLGPIERIPLGEGRTFAVADREIAVFRLRGGDVHATQARCPHRDGRLADGLLGGCTLICPLHGYKFDVATGRPIGHDCGVLTTYRAEITGARHVRLWIDASDAAPEWRDAP